MCKENNTISRDELEELLEGLKIEPDSVQNVDDTYNLVYVNDEGDYLIFELYSDYIMIIDTSEMIDEGYYLFYHEDDEINIIVENFLKGE